MLILKLMASFTLLPLLLVVAESNIKFSPRETKVTKLTMEEIKLSEEGLHFIKEKEGVVYKVYEDHGVLTAGVGHKLTWLERRKYKLGHEVSDEQVNEWLRGDIKKAEDCVKNWVITDLSQKGFDSLVSLAFNIGCEAFKRSTLLKSLNKGLVTDAADEFQRWIFSRGVKVPGLITRRSEEERMFREGELVV